jgi:hypothetical protein
MKAEKVIVVDIGYFGIRLCRGGGNYTEESGFGGQTESKKSGSGKHEKRSKIKNNS